MARRATLIASERRAGGTLLVLDAGNALIGDREPAIRTRGLSSIAAMNTLGYDAMTLGLSDISQLSLSELETCIAEAQSAVVSANVVVSSTGALVTEPAVVLYSGGHKIGILGLTEAGESAQVRATDPREAARRYLPEVAKQSEVVILLSHAGADVDREIAAEFPEIDLVVSGLSEGIYGGGMAGAALQVMPDVATAGNAGTRAGVARLTFDRANALVLHDWQQVTLGADWAEDPAMATWVVDMLAGTGPAGQ